MTSMKCSDTNPSSIYTASDDPRIIGILRQLEVITVQEPEYHGWIRSNVQRKGDVIYVEVVCTFKYPVNGCQNAGLEKR